MMYYYNTFLPIHIGMNTDMQQSVYIRNNAAMCNFDLCYSAASKSVGYISKEFVTWSICNWESIW